MAQTSDKTELRDYTAERDTFVAGSFLPKDGKVQLTEAQAKYVPYLKRGRVVKTETENVDAPETQRDAAAKTKSAAKK